MKRLLKFTLTIVFVLSILCTPAYASDTATTDRVDYADGSYALIIIHRELSRSSTSESKSYVYYNSSSVRCFSYTLTAEFTYNGRTSSADSCYATISRYDRDWDVDSHDEYTSGNTAYGSAVFSGPGGASRSVNLTLTCDKNGNVT